MTRFAYALYNPGSDYGSPLELIAIRLTLREAIGSAPWTIKVFIVDGSKWDIYADQEVRRVNLLLRIPKEDRNALLELFEITPVNTVTV